MIDHPHRVLPLEGATNFRDLGGYMGHGGRRVRWGLLHRSDHLGNLSAADQALLTQRGLAAVLDFRGVHEAAEMPCAMRGVKHHALTIEPSVVQNMNSLVATGRELNGALTHELMCRLYRDLINEQSHRYTSFFAHVLQAPGPLVFHCTAGKDRTGVAAALLLAALGVAREVIEQDFLLTNQFFKPRFENRNDLPQEVLAVLWSVRLDFLHAAFDAIDKDHGGMPRYLRLRLGLDDAAQRALAGRYLEAA